MATKILPVASYSFDAIKRNKNSVLFKSGFSKVPSEYITSTIKVARFLNNFGVDLITRTDKNWSKCKRYYFRESHVKGIYFGTIKNKGNVTFLVLQFEQGDEVLNILEFQKGYNPSKRQLVNLVNGML